MQQDNTSFPKISAALAGEWEESDPEGAKYRDLLRQQRSLDMGAGFTQLGPHKTDLVITHLEKGLLAHFCSTGEQKAMLVTMLLSGTQLTREKRGITPLILLDEIVAHLDEKRRLELYKKIVDFDASVWLTGTDSAIFSELKNKADFYHVEAAKMSKI